MEQLTIEQLAPYIPYGLKMSSHGRVYELTSFILDSAIAVQDKPLLRPLSQLTETIEHKGERFVPMARLLEMAYPAWMKEKAGTVYDTIECKSDGWHEKACFKYHAINSIEIHKGYLHNEPYWKIEQLIKWHFDVENLTGRGLALPIQSI